MSKNPPVNYIDNKRLYDAFVEWYEGINAAKAIGAREPAMPSYITDAILMIPEHLSHKINFVHYTFRDEMIGDAVENILRYVRNFDPTKSKNPFAYFTQIAYYAFIRRIMIEKKNSYIKNKLISQMNFDEYSDMLEGEEVDVKMSMLELIKQNERPDLEAAFGKKAKKIKEFEFDIEKMIEEAMNGKFEMVDGE